MPKLLIAFLFVFIAGVLAACHSTSRIRAIEARGATFEYRTYSLSEDAAKLPAGFTPSHLSPEMRHHAQAIIRPELEKRGYVLDDTSPDLEVVIASGHRPNRFRNGGGLEYDTTLLSDETLVVEVWDVRAGDIVWEGAIEGYHDHARDIDVARLSADVVEMLQAFPHAPSPYLAASPCRDVGVLAVHPCR